MAGSGGMGEGDRMLRVLEAERLMLLALRPASLAAAPPVTESVCSVALALGLTPCEPASVDAGARDVVLVGGEPTSKLLPLKLDRRLGVVCGGFIACAATAALLDEKGLGGTEAAGVGVLARPAVGAAAADEADAADGTVAAADGVLARATALLVWVGSMGVLLRLVLPRRLATKLSRAPSPSLAWLAWLLVRLGRAGLV